METIVAIYEQGVLRPLRQLPLAEHARGRVQIVEGAPHAPPLSTDSPKHCTAFEWLPCFTAASELFGD
jgi:hypothetical protein